MSVTILPVVRTLAPYRTALASRSLRVWGGFARSSPFHHQEIEGKGIPPGCPNTYMFRITNKWIWDFRTPRGGWKASQLRYIGVPWPPPKGWRQRAIGRLISEEAKAKFESFAVPQGVQSDLFLDCLDDWSRNHGKGRKSSDCPTDCGA